MPVSEKQTIRFGPFEFDASSGELFKNAHKLKLEGQPLRVLAILLETPGKLVTREEICKRLWPANTFVDSERILNADIWKLRQALGDNAENPRYIETLPKRGYRFVANIGHRREPEPTQDGTGPVKTGLVSFARGNRHPASIAAVGILLMLVATAVLVASVSRSRQPRIIGSRALTHTGYQKSRGEPYFCYLATDGSRVYFHENRNGDSWVLAQVSTRGGEISDIPVSLKNTRCLQGISPTNDELLVADCCPGWEYWGVPLPAGPAHRLPIPSGSAWALWSADKNRLLYAPEVNKEMFRVDVDGSGLTKLFAASDVTYPRMSPDGSKIRYTVFSGFEGSRRDIWEVHSDGRNPHPVFPDLQGKTYFGDWTPDGTLFFFYRQDGPSPSLWAIREKSGWLRLERSKPTLLYAGPLRLQSAVSSKDGKQLYVVGAALRGELSVYESGQRRFIPFIGGISAFYVSFSPDGQWIAYVSYPDGALWRSRADGTEKMQLTFSPMRALLPRWSPDGKLIAFMETSSSDHYAIYSVQATGGQPSLLLSGASEPAYPSWSPDGRYLAYGDLDLSIPSTQIQILDLKTMKSSKVFDSLGKISPRWSPDGRYLIALGGARELMLYSFELKKWRKLAVGPDLTWPTWSHDSKSVYAYRSGQIFRVHLANQTVEPAASLQGISWTTFRSRWYGWFDLTPDDRIMILHNTGSEDIYALDLEY